MPYRVQATATVRGSAEAIFNHIAVAEAWNVWGRFPTRAHRERDGAPEPNGVGAVRRIFPARERVVAYEPSTRYSYVALAGLPLRRYRADVTLEPRGEGTRVEWSGSFEPLVPGTGPLAKVVMGRMLGSFTSGLARHMERCEPGCPGRLN
ncbi:SRPBCC family protein [Actinomadura macrotermitis]|uniref:SRPBCC family protein n=1 Tax=Actinomadura macrotermitis TaxID=2585200 RepID=A0A7K0C218_9ACTN|nr:SRPBCC family protein [Actinomadura macrotermitis]MQY07469.1 hypothetical protein [Actinomadura macrotermitis]